MFPEWLKLVLFLLGYVVLMRWVLPAVGIPTCLLEHAESLDLGNCAQRPEGRLTKEELTICRVRSESHGRTNVISAENYETDR